MRAVPILFLNVVAWISPPNAAQEAAPDVGAWPDFRGPSWDGHAAGGDPPIEWSEDRNVRWKTAIPGVGWSSPVIWKDRIWITAATSDGETMSAIAVDFATGDIVIARDVFENDEPSKKNALNSYASPSPVVDADRVYVHFGTYGTACLDAETGKSIWERRDLRCDHMEGPGSSPVRFEDLLIFHVDGGDVQYVVALDADSGETRWKTERSEPLDQKVPDLRKAYSTPIIVEVDGAPRLISSGANATMGYDPRTGRELWKVRHGGFSMSSRPITDGRVIYLNTGFMRPELVAVRADGDGDVTDSHVEWTYRRSVPTMPSPVLVDGRIFLVSDDGMASCVGAATGERIWNRRLDAAHCASLLYAAGRVYFFDRDGRAVVIAAGDEFRQLATNELDGGLMASPAVVGDALVLRTRTHLYRVEETGGELAGDPGVLPENDAELLGRRSESSRRSALNQP